MTGLYSLPVQADIGGCIYDLNTDFRVILRIFQALEDHTLPEFLRWQVALRLFYRQPLPRNVQSQAMEYLVQFLLCGREDTPGAPLIDWQQDASAIIAGVNRTAGQEVRALPYVHWWTFLSWFHAMEPGELSTLVSIRDKLRRGKKLDAWEQEFYRQNKARVELKKSLTPEEAAHKAQLNALLGT